MTGFGRGVVESNGVSVTAEIKTLNSKGVDIFCRLPRSLSSKEIELRNLLSAELERGKIEINLTLVKTAQAEASVSVNRPLVKAYFQDIRESFFHLSNSFDDLEIFKMAMSWPNALNTETVPETSDAEWQTALQAIRTALAECQDFREREGGVLVDIFGECINRIENGLKQVAEQDVLRIPAVRERLLKSITDLLGEEGFDKNRFEQELVYYVEKYDISEEKVRLQTHLDYFREVLTEGNGKKLGFLAQEIGREINTIGSKANDAVIQRLVVGMKDELEKIKEQTSNVL
ncbi:TIGR00255 family protein [Siphonobacter aquaeclarae]|uniref:TIGR00255 family protein n=2 Tax=Siphonobacter aquaeclarae TaxID=563176 RepID=A0A1G9PP29_9BACT|nr:TIGR00255 family protein [Siphonobacter aquaeclarae]